MMMKRILICIFLAVGVCNLTTAQNTDISDNARIPNNSENYVELNSAMQKLAKKLENAPVDIKRIQPLNISYESQRITDQGFKLIRNEIKRVISQESRFDILNIEEIDAKKFLKITGTDSSLQISNASSRSQGETYDNKLSELSEEYAIDAFLNGNIQYEDDVGFIINLEMVNAKSKSIAWSATVMSKKAQTDKEVKEGRTFLMSLGVNLLTPTFYTFQGTRYNSDINYVDYNLNFALRQPINDKYSGYFGITGGYHNYRMSTTGDISEVKPYNISMMELGLFFYKTLAQKPNSVDEFWVELYAGPQMLLFINNDNQFAMAQGLHVNVTRNLGLNLNLQFLLSGASTFKNENETKMTEINNTNYGLKLLLRF